MFNLKGTCDTQLHNLTKNSIRLVLINIGDKNTKLIFYTLGIFYYYGNNYYIIIFIIKSKHILTENKLVNILHQIVNYNV